MSEYKPAYILGLSRGGLTPGVMLSHYMDVPFFAINPDEVYLWVIEDCFNYVDNELQLRKNILIIDDINDTGKTFNNLKGIWMNNYMRNHSQWSEIWHNNVRFAALIDNVSSEFKVDFWGHEINKGLNPEWCVFPWEQWW